jgi:hypothetical protein
MPCHSKLFFLECLLDEAWTIFEVLHVSFMRMSHPSPVAKNKYKTVLNGPSHHNYVVDSGEHIGPEITKVLIKIYRLQEMNQMMTKNLDNIPNSTFKSL